MPPAITNVVKPKRTDTPNRKVTRMQMESLESRDMFAGLTLGSVSDSIPSSNWGPAALVPAEGISLVGSTVYIQGNEHVDDAVVTEHDGQLTVTHNQTRMINFQGMDIPIITHSEQTINKTEVDKIVFYGHESNDSFRNDSFVESVALGGDGDDNLVGGVAVDKLFGGDGNDTLEGRQNSDILNGGADDDTYVYSFKDMPGSSVYLGQDSIVEAAHADEDVLDFRGLTVGVDIDLSLTSNQWVVPYWLRIELSTGSGIENVHGTAKSDDIVGNSRNNRFWGGDDDDNLVGGTGYDRLYGQGGNDTLNGEEMWGGSGADSFWYQYGEDFDAEEGDKKLRYWITLGQRPRAGRSG